MGLLKLAEKYSDSRLVEAACKKGIVIYGFFASYKSLSNILATSADQTGPSENGIPETRNKKTKASTWCRLLSEV